MTQTSINDGLPFYEPLSLIGNSLGRKLTKLRIDKALSQQEVASEIGMSNSNLSHYEKGNRVPSLSTFIRLCKFYDVSPQEMLHDDFQI